MYLHGTFTTLLPKTPPFNGEPLTVELGNPTTDQQGMDVEAVIEQVAQAIRGGATLTDLDKRKRHITVYIWPTEWQALFNAEEKALCEHQEKEREAAEALAVQREREEAEASNALVERCIAEVTLEQDELFAILQDAGVAGGKPGELDEVVANLVNVLANRLRARLLTLVPELPVVDPTE